MLTRIKTLALAAAGLALAALSVTPAFADNPTVLALTEDADRHTTPRKNRMYNRVLEALKQEMHVRGFTVFDETAATGRFADTSRVRRTDEEIISIARGVRQPPIDALLIFQIYSAAIQKPGGYLEPSVRIAGRLLNVQTGQHLGNFELSGFELPPLSRECTQAECILEEVGDHARRIARDVGNALAQQLATVRPGARSGGPTDVGPSACGGTPLAYRLVFDGFTHQEMRTIGEAVASFNGYCRARLAAGGGLTTEYWYETQVGSADLNYNLSRMLDRIDAPGQVHFGTGNTFRIIKNPMRPLPPR